MQPPSLHAAASNSSSLRASDVALLHEQFAAILTRLSACDGHFTGKRSKSQHHLTCFRRLSARIVADRGCVFAVQIAAGRCSCTPTNPRPPKSTSLLPLRPQRPQLLLHVPLWPPPPATGTPFPCAAMTLLLAPPLRPLRSSTSRRLRIASCRSRAYVPRSCTWKSMPKLQERRTSEFKARTSSSQLDAAASLVT
jgi:hypothetical protein